MKTVYKAQNLLIYRVSDEGEIQFRDTTMELGWKRSEFLTFKAQKLGLPAQEILDKEARRQGWIVVKEAPEQAEEKTPLNSHCKTGKSPSGYCGAAACCNEPYDCCAQCPNDCNSRCGWISAKEETVPCKTEPAPKPAAAATTEPPAVTISAETSTTSESEGDAGASTLKPLPPDAPTNLSAPASPADAGAATQSLSAAAPVSLEAPAAFDYSGLDRPTADALHWAEGEICDARRDYVARLAQAVYIAHDALCGGVVHNVDNSKHGNRGDAAFVSWCASVGLGKTTAYKLLQVAALLNGSTPEEQAVLEAASPSLLYAAAKPSAPAELVQGVKDGDITTHKQYQELLAQFKAKEQELADEKAAHKAESAAFSEMFNDEQRLRREADEARRAAEKAAQGAKESYSIAQKNEALAIRRAKEAKNQLADAQHRISELEARPVEVVGVDPDEIQRRAEKLAEEKTRELRSDMDQLVQEHDAAVDALNASDQRRDALTLARVLDAVNACEDLLRRQFEGLYHADYDRIYVPATDMMEDLCSKISQAILDGEWPREEEDL